MDLNPPVTLPVFLKSMQGLQYCDFFAAKLNAVLIPEMKGCFFLASQYQIKIKKKPFVTGVSLLFFHCMIRLKAVAKRAAPLKERKKERTDISGSYTVRIIG